mgnify:CR=1 FL=1
MGRLFFRGCLTGPLRLGFAQPDQILVTGISEKLFQEKNMTDSTEDSQQQAEAVLLELLHSEDERVRLRASIVLLQNRRKRWMTPEDIHFDLSELEGPEW